MAAVVIATASADLEIVIAVVSQKCVQTSRPKKVAATVISRVSPIANRANRAPKVVAVPRPVAHNSRRASNSHNEHPLLLQPRRSKAQRQPQPELLLQLMRNATVSVVTEVNVASAVVAVVAAVVVVAAVAAATMATPARVATVKVATGRMAAKARPKAAIHLVVLQAVGPLEKAERPHLVSRTRAVAAISTAVLQ